MSRQRIRASVLESSTEPCSQCGGSGHVRSVSSVALQLLRGLEEILMKGATHNLVVRTRTDVALYVLNHKRGHLRDLENSFKVSLAVFADSTVSGQQSFIIDRGEQVHSWSRQGAAGGAGRSIPAASEEAFDEDELDIETESEIETEETEGLADEAAGGDEAEPAATAARGASGGGGGAAVPANRAKAGLPATTARTPASRSRQRLKSRTTATPTRTKPEEQPGVGRGDQPGGERRPRRRGRRGGRRRRGGLEAVWPDRSPTNWAAVGARSEQRGR